MPRSTPRASLVHFWDNPYLLTSITALSPIFSLALTSAYAKYLSTHVDMVTEWPNDDKKIWRINRKKGGGRVYVRWRENPEVLTAIFYLQSLLITQLLCHMSMRSVILQRSIVGGSEINE
jgi:hypothetical protein